MFSLPSSFSAHDLGTTASSSSLYYQGGSSSINNDQLDDDYTNIGYSGNGQYEDDENDYEPESGSDTASDTDDDDEIAGAIIKPIQDIDQNDDMYHMNPHSSSVKIKKKQRKIREKREAEKREKIISKLSRPDHPQYDRYENFTRSTFKPVMKRLINNSTSTPSTNKNVEITIAGIAKVYVGELVELSKTIQKEWGDDPSDPIEPRHLREAYRRNREKENKKKKYAFR
ncbi:predicted protein [Naegleria gruberi]|uniref:Predicted protein n=1 Tax=Naegleria gruberi TaxID=5762 RepID=D2UZ99_NAEGR|nr:uncharacterized protein NAEGRDRAFT_45427 [Naegleria gruberi]EFC50114.1 predicted protein [Naegleria gruberi]|eukprot:XP_002682858.1 predicted protein [Naegleria gruberi strain NEG-M]